MRREKVTDVATEVAVVQLPRVPRVGSGHTVGPGPCGPGIMPRLPPEDSLPSPHPVSCQLGLCHGDAGLRV